MGWDPVSYCELDGCLGQVARKHYGDSESVMTFVNSKSVEVGNKRDLEDILNSEDCEPVFITWISYHYSGFCYS